ncbi:UbiH/UbiF family hydroxylase [Paludibacterium purpuratum]|uniref:2-octaprenyl-3-methyl-6-methoxy-1,4-benzoquinol hydroxylase n=1 Tax=Paludibacterium purpuratum TaxID=1144873 RepID=A0A4R7BGR1_9NEIS|nr:UbiH/UbiF family hydroxylase [Paludibacterium purpuratum]TDR82947.1 2-octaprenyl-3-methyl-6-methoxy-1,4-benzoquinol hydroxylase [Paludibacterium purpuratum]
MSEQTFDVIVSGGGLVGASLALALARQGREVALVEPNPPALAGLEAGWDARIYAVSPQNQAFLASLAAWPGAERIGRIASMDVRGDLDGRLVFSAAEIGATELASIAENRWMLASLWQAIRQSDIVVIEGQRARHFDSDVRQAKLTLDDGRILKAALLAGADGANSWLRREAGIAASVKSYGQSGVVANFACERPHGECARQWFLGDGVLAWLPLPGNRISMVWSMSDSARLLALDDAALADTVARAGGEALGALTTMTPAAAFPLRLIRPEHVVRQRLALLGDAAHTVHPLAGQGVNLGFQDAAMLAASIGRQGDPGEWIRLRRYERSRREAVLTMQTACDGLFRLFHQPALPGLARLRNTGLSLVNHLGPLKRQLARVAVGF